MGKFLQDIDEISYCQVAPGMFRLLSPLEYQISETEKIIVPSGYETDGYSKPQVTKALVDGSFGDDIRPAIVHDFLCQYHEFKNEYDGNIVKVSFKRANDIFYQAMTDIKMPLWKRITYRIAVSFNPKKW